MDCDAPSYGLGSVLSHKMPDGKIKPIAYVSRTLTNAERNYSQLDKECLAIVFGVGRFKQYIYGRKFCIRTDHKPLLGLLGEQKGIPANASPRMIRWALSLSGFEYELQYRRGTDHANADGLSRLPIPGEPTSVLELQETIMSLEFLEKTAVTADDVESWTEKDPVLKDVMKYCMKGWPEKCKNEQLKPYFKRRTELSVEQGILFTGNGWLSQGKDVVEC